MDDRNLCRNLLSVRKLIYIILLVLIPLVYVILTAEKKEWFHYQYFIGAHQTGGDGRVSVNKSQSFWDGQAYHGINLIDLPTHKFDPRYKNPCWRERGELRCLPYFFIVGVMKSGTSELWKYVTSHPNFARPGFRKELQWFAKERFKPGKQSYEYFVNAFTPAARRIVAANKENQRHLITGEASPSNVYNNSHWRYLPGNEDLDEPKYVILDYIRHIQPQAKILIIFRDPVNRLYSEYYHRYGRRHAKKTGIPTPERFHDLVVKGLRLYKECLENRTIRACVYDERIYEPLNKMECHVCGEKIPTKQDKIIFSADTGHLSSIGARSSIKASKLDLQLGWYHVYWEELQRVFPRENVLYLQNKDLHDIDTFMEPVFKFLGLVPVPFKNKMKLRHANSRWKTDISRGEMLNTTRKMLIDFYRPHNIKMYRLTGDPAFLYHLSTK